MAFVYEPSFDYDLASDGACGGKARANHVHRARILEVESRVAQTGKRDAEARRRGRRAEVAKLSAFLVQPILLHQLFGFIEWSLAKRQFFNGLTGLRNSRF